MQPAPPREDPPCSLRYRERKKVTFAASQVERLSTLEPISEEGDGPSGERPPAADGDTRGSQAASDDESAANRDPVTDSHSEADWDFGAAEEEAVDDRPPAGPGDPSDDLDDLAASQGEEESRGGMRRNGLPIRIWVDRRGDSFVNTTTLHGSRTESISGIAVRVLHAEEGPVIDVLKEVVILRLKKLRSLNLSEQGFLETQHRQDVIKQLKDAWESRQNPDELAALWGHCNPQTWNVYHRTMQSRFRTWCFQMLGGLNWAHLFVATGEASEQLVSLVNAHNDTVIRREARREPSTNPVPGPRRSVRNEALFAGTPEDEAPPRRGVQHWESGGKSARKHATDLKKELARADQQWKRGVNVMSPAHYNSLRRRCEDQHD